MLNNKLVLQVFLAGVRDDSYTTKDNVRKERLIADLYLPGSGAFTIPLDRQVYDVLVNVSPMSALYDLPVEIVISDRVASSASGFQYARRELGLKFGLLTPAAAGRKVG